MDASATRAGAVLLAAWTEVNHPVCYFSAKLSINLFHHLEGDVGILKCMSLVLSQLLYMQITTRLQ